MTIEKYRHPAIFYGLATAVPWGILSFSNDDERFSIY